MCLSRIIRQKSSYSKLISNLTSEETRNNIVITMYTQKVFQAGNSFAVVIPKELLRRLDLKLGSVVNVDASPDNSRFIAEKPVVSKNLGKSGSKKQFSSWVKQIIEEDAEILDELAKH